MNWKSFIEIAGLRLKGVRGDTYYLEPVDRRLPGGILERLNRTVWRLKLNGEQSIQGTLDSLLAQLKSGRYEAGTCICGVEGLIVDGYCLACRTFD